MNNCDMPASPTHRQVRIGELECSNTGLTKREAFAMAAMQSIASESRGRSSRMIAFAALSIADALLKELEN